MFKYLLEYRTTKHHRPHRWVYHNAFNDKDIALLNAECLRERRKDIIAIRIRLNPDFRTASNNS